MAVKLYKVSQLTYSFNKRQNNGYSSNNILTPLYTNNYLGKECLSVFSNLNNYLLRTKCSRSVENKMLSSLKYPFHVLLKYSTLFSCNLSFLFLNFWIKFLICLIHEYVYFSRKAWKSGEDNQDCRRIHQNYIYCIQ